MHPTNQSTITTITTSCSSHSNGRITYDIEGRREPNAGSLPIPIIFECKASFLPTQAQSCPVCLEDAPPRSYVICHNRHTACEECAKLILKEAATHFRIVNEYHTAAHPPFQVIAERSMLPKCPFRCDIPLQMTVSEERSEALIPAQITWINYAPGQTIHVTPYDIDLNQGNMLLGKLNDGTEVYFLDVTPSIAFEIIRAKKTISAMILAKTVENGQVYLKCTSDALIPPQRKNYVGEQITVTIQELHDGYSRGSLGDGAWVNFFGAQVSIGDTVSGYVASQDLLCGEFILLNCTPYQQGQMIQFTVDNIDHSANGCGMLFGTLAGGATEIEFIPNPATGGCAAYRVGQTIAAVIRAIDTDVETAMYESGACLMCSAEDYPITARFEESDSS